MGIKVLIASTNYGSWGEELQAPWDILKEAGFEVTLTTPLGKKPLPLQVSVNPDFIDPVQNYKTNPPEVCIRIKELVDGEEWSNPVKFKDANMADYDAIVLTGGLGSMIDMCNNYHLHKLIMDAYASNKLIGALCYAVTTLVYLRDPKNDFKSLIYGKNVTAHPRAWDFYGDYDFTYDLYGATEDNRGTDVHTPGFLCPIENLVKDAIGPDGFCYCDPGISREKPMAVFDWPFITATSVESSIAYGRKITEVLNSRFCHGDIVKKQPQPDGTTRQDFPHGINMNILHSTLKDGAIVASHFHPEEQMGYIIKGSLEVNIGDQKETLKAGDAYFVPPNILHHFVAIGDTETTDTFSPVHEFWSLKGPQSI